MHECLSGGSRDTHTTYSFQLQSDLNKQSVRLQPRGKLCRDKEKESTPVVLCARCLSETAINMLCGQLSLYDVTKASYR